MSPVTQVLPSVGAALGAAVTFAVAAVAQQRAAAQSQGGAAVDPALLLRLARRPLWLAGMGATLATFALQAVALRLGSLTVVEPVLATGLVFALPLGAWVWHTRMRRRDWAASLVTAGGLATFLVIAAPDGGRAVAATTRLSAVSAIAAGVGILAIAGARRADPARRALLLSAGAGFGAGVTDALTKTVTAVVATQGGGVFADPRLYLLATVGLGTFLVQQNGYRSGGLAVSLPAFAVGEPLTGTVLGLVLYHERLRAQGFGLGLAIVAAGAALAGIARLANSPLVHPNMVAD
jgi:hypothetical protein